MPTFWSGCWIVRLSSLIKVYELICVEIPDIDADLESLAIATTYIFHGHSKSCQTTGVSRCSKVFLKAYAEEK